MTPPATTPALGPRSHAFVFVFAFVCAFAALAFAGCGGAQSEQRTAPKGAPNYPSKCWLIGIEEVEAPSDQDPDSVGLVARYRFGEGQSSESPVSLHFQIARARKNDLMQHLESHSNVVCNPPEATNAAGKPQPASVSVPPFEGQSGQPVP